MQRLWLRQFEATQGASRRLLVAALEQRFTLLVSVALMVEYEAVMTRTQHLAASKLWFGSRLRQPASNSSPTTAAVWECDFVRQGGNDRGNELIYPPNSQGAADQKLSGQRRAA